VFKGCFARINPAAIIPYKNVDESSDILRIHAFPHTSPRIREIKLKIKILAHSASLPIS
jgi:hypothetical protein